MRNLRNRGKVLSAVVHFFLAPVALGLAILLMIPSDVSTGFSMLLSGVVLYLACLRLWSWIAVGLELLETDEPSR